MRFGTTPVLLLLFAFLAGCTNGPAGQSVSGDGSLAYNGASAGEQTARRGCGGDGTLHWSANLGSGALTIRVLDGAGATAWSTTMSGPGQDAQQTGLRGAPGTWNVHAVRGSGFTGQYAVRLEC